MREFILTKAGAMKTVDANNGYKHQETCSHRPNASQQIQLYLRCERAEVHHQGTHLCNRKVTVKWMKVI